MTHSSSSSSSSSREVRTMKSTKTFYLAILLLISPTTSFRARSSTQTRVFAIQSSTVTAPADLTPAIDKFVKLPTGPNVNPYFMTAKGPVPVGPEPFGLVSDELQSLSDYVKELVVSENPVLTMAASHFFEKVEVHRYKSFPISSKFESNRRFY